MSRPRKLTDEQRLANKRANALVQNAKHPYHTRDLRSRLVWAARKRAKEKGLPFDITVEDITVPELCPYLGIPLVPTVSRGQPRTHCVSLDRVKPELGYVRGNVEVISHLANTMKNNATPRQLFNFALEIMRRYDNDLL